MYCQEVGEVSYSELCLRCGLFDKDAGFLNHQITKARFCSFYHNQTRHSLNAAFLADPQSSENEHGCCIFKGNGCSCSSNTLRALPCYSRDTLEDEENYYDFEDSVQSHSAGGLHILDVDEK